MDLARDMKRKAGLVNVDEKNKCFEFKCEPFEYQEGYYIAFDKCDSPEAIVRWVNHLLPKNWVTKDVIETFIGCAMKKIHYPIHPV